MTLYDYIKELSNGHFCKDTYDTVFDYGITIDLDLKDGDYDSYYDKFCTELTKFVEIDHIDGDFFVLKWYEFFERNIDLFRDYAVENWDCGFSDDYDDDDLIYDWMQEIHSYYAGGLSENGYREFCEQVIANLV